MLLLYTVGMVLKRVQTLKDTSLISSSDISPEDKQKPASAVDKPPVITHVVEVVEEPSATQPQESINQSFRPQVPAPAGPGPGSGSMKLPLDDRAVIDDMIARPVQVKEPIKTQAAAQSVPPGIAAHLPVNHKEEKEVISELFSPEASVGYPDISEHKKNPVKGLVLWGVVVLFIAGAIGSVILFISQGSETVSTVAVTPLEPSPSTGVPVIASTSIATPAATPTHISSDTAKSNLSIQILNGGGERGAAAKMKSFLEGLGYSVKNTGNAPDYNYDKTEIYVKPDKESFLPLLEKDLESDYSIGKKEATLEDDIPFDARIIVGK